MTNDKTQIAPAELRTYSKNAADRAGDTRAGLDSVQNVHLDRYMFGIFGAFVASDVESRRQDLLSGLGEMVCALESDSTTASAIADDVDNKEAKHADQFNRTDVP